MASAVVAAPLTVLTAEQIRDNFLRTVRNGLQTIGVANPNVSPGTDWYIEGQGIGNELAVAMASIQTYGDNLMPDTAVDDDLVRWATLLKLENGAGGYGKRSATGASGFVVLECTGTVAVATGEELTDALGQRFEVANGGSYTNGQQILVQGVDTGATTNHDEGDSLSWSVTPAGAQGQVLVAPGGLTNGIDDEDNETLRQRVLNRLGNPPGGGNWTQVAELATNATPKVQAAFVYPALRGPATLGVAVTAYATATSKNRDVDAVTMSSIVTPSIVGGLPEHIDVNTTTVANVNADVSIGINIPSAQTASPPGPGGGWVNGNPWPQIDPYAGSPIRYAAVGTVTSATQFTVVARAGSSAQAGVTKVCWLSYSGADAWTLYTATVLSCVESPSGTYTITLDSAFAGIAAGDYVFPAAVNTSVYVDALIAAFGRMGPGEKRNPILSREYRHPLPGTQWPNTLGAHLLRALSDSGEELADAQFYSRLPDSTLNYSVENTSGSVGVPSAITDPPRIFVPRKLALYQLT